MALQRIAQALKIACEYIVVKDPTAPRNDIRGLGYLFLFMAETKLSLDSASILITLLERGETFILRPNLATLKKSNEEISPEVAEELHFNGWIGIVPGTKTWTVTPRAMQAWLTARGKAITGSV